MILIDMTKLFLFNFVVFLSVSK